MPLTLTRSLLVVLIPGLVALAPWLLLAVQSWPDLKTTYAEYTGAANVVLFALVVLIGSVFEGLATHVEVRWDRQRESEFNILENWYAYLASCAPEPVGNRYIARMVTTFYFELAMLWASIAFLVGAATNVWLSSVRYPLKAALLVLGAAVGAAFYFRWQARCSHQVLCEVRRELAARAAKAAAQTVTEGAGGRDAG